MTRLHTQATPTPHTPPSRASFAREEILRVLEQYPTGSVQSIREMIAGSSEAPKAVIECERGKLLLKRRARGLEHASLVGFAHEVILGCLERGVCVPPIIGTTADNNSMCQIGDQTYELFVFIEGTMFDQSVEHARQAGMLLGELHSVMDEVTTSFEPTVETKVVNPDRVVGLDLSADVLDRAKRVLEYGFDAHRANARGPAIVHGDWHPGNMIFDGPEIISICDFDNCRKGSRDRELAQALVYLSMKRPNADQIPSEASTEHMRAVWEGYTSRSSVDLNPRLIGSLIPAVLLDEALAGGVDDRSRPLVETAIKKATWLDERGPEIVRLLEQSA